MSVQEAVIDYALPLRKATQIPFLILVLFLADRGNEDVHGAQKAKLGQTQIEQISARFLEDDWGHILLQSEVILWSIVELVDFLEDLDLKFCCRNQFVLILVGQGPRCRLTLFDRFCLLKLCKGLESVHTGFALGILTLAS